MSKKLTLEKLRELPKKGWDLKWLDASDAPDDPLYPTQYVGFKNQGVVIYALLSECCPVMITE